MYERLREQAEAEEASRRLEAERTAAAAAAERRDSAISNQVSKPAFEQVEENEDEQVKLQIEKLEKEKKEKNERLKKEEKKYDHFVRACHEVELPSVAKFAEEDAKARKKFWDEKEVERIENLKREQQIQAENRDRLLRMVEEKLKFEKNVHDKRGEIFQTQMAEFQQRLQVAREQKLRERREQRKVERRTAYLKEIEDRKKREVEERKLILLIVGVEEDQIMNKLF
jgi:translation initiation factor 3 subunit A